MLGTIEQADFSRGIVRQVEGQRIAQDGVYDCVNGLLDDDMGIYRRGGSAYYSSANAAATIRGFATVQTAAGLKTLLWTSTTTYVLDGSLAPASVAITAPPTVQRRGCVVAGAFVVPSVPATSTVLAGYPRARIFGGSSKATYTTGTATATTGSSTVTGAGTAWLANVEAGMLFAIDSLSGAQTVRSVETDTSLTLWNEWSQATAAGAAYTTISAGTLTLTAARTDDPLYVTTAGGRLIAAVGDRVSISPLAGAAFNGFSDTDYHLLQQAGTITGAQGISDTAVIFTTSGAFAISNMAYDLTDDYGNPQQQVRRLSDNLILWDDAGVVSWQGGLVAPAIDDVYLVSLSGEQVPVSGAIRPLYRSYVKAGYQTGLASIHRGHYFLPIVSGGTTWVDTLVCRLDGSEPGWVRWADHAGGIAFAQQVSSSTTARAPKLLGVSGQRITDLSGCFTPSSANKADADGTTHVLSVVTRDYATRGQVRNLWRYLRARFQLDDAASDNPTLTLESSAGPPETESWVSSGSWAEGTGEDSSKIAILNSDGNPGRRVQSIRFRIQSSGPAARLVLRSLEVFFRPSGRQ